MRIALNVLIGLLIVAHLLFFGLEAIFWEDSSAESAREHLNFTQKDQSEVAKVAKNQGLSNAFLAAGLAWGLWGLRIGKPEGRPVLIFFLVFIAIAGIFGYRTIQPDIVGTVGFLIGQTGLALGGLWCIYRLSPGASK